MLNVVICHSTPATAGETSRDREYKWKITLRRRTAFWKNVSQLFAIRTSSGEWNVRRKFGRHTQKTHIICPYRKNRHSVIALRSRMGGRWFQRAETRGTGVHSCGQRWTAWKRSCRSSYRPPSLYYSSDAPMHESHRDRVQLAGAHSVRHVLEPGNPSSTGHKWLTPLRWRISRV